MKKLVLVACAVAGFVGSSFAGDWTRQTIGNFDYYHGANGANGFGQQIGNFYYYHGTDQFGQPHSGTGQQIGNFYYYHGN